MKLTGAEIIMECLLEQGVDTVFGYPGGAVLNIYDALYQYHGKIRHITTAHEQAAAHAADGYARSSGKTGAVSYTHLDVYKRQTSRCPRSPPVRFRFWAPLPPDSRSLR